MDGQTTISIALIIALVGLASQIYAIYNGHKKNKEDEAKKEIEMEKHFMSLDLKLDQFKENTTAMLKNQEAHAIRMEKLSGELIQTNEKIATLFKYKDDHEERIKKLENH